MDITTRAERSPLAAWGSWGDQLAKCVFNKLSLAAVLCLLGGRQQKFLASKGRRRNRKEKRQRLFPRTRRRSLNTVTTTRNGGGQCQTSRSLKNRCVSARLKIISSIIRPMRTDVVVSWLKERTESPASGVSLSHPLPPRPLKGSHGHPDGLPHGLSCVSVWGLGEDAGRLLRFHS